MFITVRRFKIRNGSDINDVVRRIRADLVPALQAICGYKNFRIVDFRDESFGSIGLYATEHGANRANQVAIEMTRVRFSDLLTYTSMKTFRTIYEAGADEQPEQAGEADFNTSRVAHLANGFLDRALRIS